jgi:hypothetical protein
VTLGGPQSGDANLHYGAGLGNLPKRCLERPRPLRRHALTGSITSGFQKLARFGDIFFDNGLAVSQSTMVWPSDGDTVDMVDGAGNTIARAQRPANRLVKVTYQAT